MNIFWLLRGGGPFFGKWQVVVDIFWLVVGGGGYILAGGGWWWMVVGRGIIQSNLEVIAMTKKNFTKNQALNFFNRDSGMENFAFFSKFQNTIL